MNKTESELFRQALIEAFERKYERELAECSESAQCSEEHTYHMNEIITQSIEAERRKSRREWMIALLVAAALLLSALTVGAYYKEIQAFIEQINQDHIRLTFNDDSQTAANEEMDLRYTLGYVPEGYTMWQVDSVGLANYSEWRNEEGDYVIFKQSILHNARYYMDDEAVASSLLSVEGYEVYCSDYGAVGCSYVWNDGVYTFILRTSMALTEESLTKMIQSVRLRS